MSLDNLTDSLTERELEILRLLEQRLSNREIAEELFLSVGTVKWYLKQIFSKLGADSRRDAVQRAHSLHLLDTPPAATRRTIPVPGTPFIGRKDDLHDLALLLADPAVRLVTLLGMGGIGKTRLALELIQRCGEQFQDGAYFIALVAISGAESVPASIAEALGYTLQKDARDAGQQLADYLSQREVLLILDNFEHVLAAAPLLAQIIAAAPGVKLLVTSRTRLNLQVETVYTLEGLSYPDDDQPPLEYDAVRLFVQSARRARPDFAADDAASLTRICQLTQGLPLGLELAAGWLATLPLSEIVAEIETSVEFLAAEFQDLPERQRSIRATFDYSWRSLTQAEQATFARLSVFRGGFSLEAARIVARANLPTLRKLVNTSLLYARPGGRYQPHELLRQYAEEQLLRATAEIDTLDRHARYYAHLIRTASAQPPQLFQAEVEREYDNLVAAWNWLLLRRDFATLRACLDPFWWYLSGYGRHYEGIDLLEKARELIYPDHDPLLYGHLLTRLAELYRSVDTATGYQLLDEAIARLEALPPSSELLHAYLLSGSVYHETETNDLKTEHDALDKALKIAVVLDDLPALAQIYFLKGMLTLNQGDYAEALRLGGQALEYRQQGGPLPFSHQWIEGLLGQASYRLGDYDTARTQMLAALAASEAVVHLFWVSQARIRLWVMAHEQQQTAEARLHVREMLAWHERYGRDWQILGSLYAIAEHWFLLTGETARAVELLAYVHQHPFTTPVARAETGGLLERVRPLLPGYDAAYGRLAGHPLDRLVTTLLAEFSR